MYKYIALILFFASCTTKCDRILKRAYANNCIKDSIFYNKIDSFVIHDSINIVTKTKDSIVIVTAQEGETGISIKEGSTATIKLGEGGWIKAIVEDSTIKLSYYIPPRTSTFKESETNTSSVSENSHEGLVNQSKTETIPKVVEKPIPKIIIYLAIFGGLSLGIFAFLLYRKFKFW